MSTIPADSASDRMRVDAAIGVAARRIVYVALFVLGIAAGIAAYHAANPALDYGAFPPRPEVAEPAAADTLTDTLVAGDDVTLSKNFSATVLSQLGTALAVGGTPLTEITDIHYLGAVQAGTDTIAMYAAFGPAGNMGDVVVGFSVRVRNGQVLGVN